jgi:hypothetical protein
MERRNIVEQLDSRSYHEGFSNGYIEGFTRAMEILQKELEKAKELVEEK